MTYNTKSPDKQSVCVNNTNCNCNSSSNNKEGIILFQNVSIANKDDDDDGNGNDNVNVIPSPRSQNSNEENDIQNNISKLPSLNVNNTTNNNHSLNHSNDNEIQPQLNSNTNTSKDAQSQLNANEILNSNQISFEHSNKIKLIQTAYRNYILHKNLNTNNPNAIKHAFKYSSNIFNFSVNNPSVEALNINPKEKPSSHTILDSPDINLKNETYLNGVQFDSNNNNNNNNTNSNTTIENTETIPDNYELTQQRANKLFPLFTSIANDISLLYRINKITQTQHNNNNKERSSPPSSPSSHDIIENDNEVFN